MSSLIKYLILEQELQWLWETVGIWMLVVSSSKPREEAGMYWGYKVHYASNITSVMIECPYEGGYDHLIRTSEHGQIINSSDLTIPTFRLTLIERQLLLLLLVDLKMKLSLWQPRLLIQNLVMMGFEIQHCQT